MPTQYTLTIKNRAAYPAYFMIFQNDPTSWSPNAMALAWFSKFSNPSPTTQIKFTWSVDWGFSWADTGILQPGIMYEASETLAATSTVNKVTLDYNGAYRFIDPTKGPDSSRLYLQQNGSIPINSSASVGVTMSGNTVYATQARPNVNLTFSPHPTYYLAYGQYVQGDVIDVSAVNNPLELPYATGVYSLQTTLNADGTWTPPISTAQMNARILKARGSAETLKHWTELALTE
jgi:rhizosphere induced protein